jgi:hypothetical protein
VSAAAGLETPTGKTGGSGDVTVESDRYNKYRLLTKSPRCSALRLPCEQIQKARCVKTISGTKRALKKENAIKPL